MVTDILVSGILAAASIVLLMLSCSLYKIGINRGVQLSPWYWILVMMTQGLCAGFNCFQFLLKCLRVSL